MQRPCLGCGTLTRHPKGRCPPCLTQARAHYDNPTYRADAAQVRATATRCWICGQGPRPNDPWHADHLEPGQRTSELLPAHASCNVRRGNEMR